MKLIVKHSCVVVCAALVSACGSHQNWSTISSKQMQGARYSAPTNSDVGQDRSEYPEYSENGVVITAKQPVSTFSIDVDTSSYGVMRSYIERGEMPPPQAIRTEELLNYFSYQYPLPASKDQPFNTHISVLDSPWSDTKQLVRVGIRGYDIDMAEQPDSNLVFLLDVSGSMGASNKLPLLVKSIKLLLKSLKPSDTISLVVYAGASGVVLPPTQASQVDDIHAALNRLSAGGGTAGNQGLALAYEVAQKSFKKDGVNRIILGTDGDFNIGPSSNSELQKMVERNRESGVYISVLGFGGYNYQDDMMQAIAQNGNGVAAYIDTLQEAKKVLIDEASSTLFPIANDVKIQLEFNPQNVAEYRLLGYETRALKQEDFNNDKVDAGEIGAGHSVTALYEITSTQAAAARLDPLRYANKNEEKAPKPAQFTNEIGFLKVRYKLPGETSSKLISQAITFDDGRDDEAMFATSVASFAELLRGSKQSEDYGFNDVAQLAKEFKGSDPSGYRAEFIQLVEMAGLIEN